MVNGEGHVVQTELASAQRVELLVVAIVFQIFANKTFNLYTDSQYIFNALQLLETIQYVMIHNKEVKMLFQQIQNAYSEEDYNDLWGIAKHIKACSKAKML